MLERCGGSAAVGKRRVVAAAARHSLCVCACASVEGRQRERLCVRAAPRAWKALSSLCLMPRFAAAMQ
eukprot:6176111-Pleurochrysis_carterae.AAC.1